MTIENKAPGKDVSSEDLLNKFPLASIHSELSNHRVCCAGVEFGGDVIPIFAGPNTVENRDMIVQCARQVKDRGASFLRGGAYKPLSFPYRGPKYFELREEGLEYLAEAKSAANIPVITEVMHEKKVSLVAEVADILQIGTRNMQNYALLEEVAAMGKPVMLKRHNGAIAGAHHVHTMAEAYGVSVILHTDHCARNLLPWVDGLLDAGEAHYAKTGKPLFSSHMIDLSEESLEENLETCAGYLKRMAAIDMHLEIELGVTGGEEDGVDNTDIDSSRLYTQPEEVAEAYKILSAISPNFTVAAAFGNVHGVYKPGNVELRPSILNDCQKHIEESFETTSRHFSEALAACC